MSKRAVRNSISKYGGAQATKGHILGQLASKSCSISKYSRCSAKLCILSQIQVGFKPIPEDTANLHHHWCTCLCASPLMFNVHSLATQQHRKQVALSARWEKEELIGVDAISSRITPQSPPHNNSSTSGLKNCLFQCCWLIAFWRTVMEAPF